MDNITQIQISKEVVNNIPNIWDINALQEPHVLRQVEDAIRKHVLQVMEVEPALCKPDERTFLIDLVNPVFADTRRIPKILTFHLQNRTRDILKAIGHNSIYAGPLQQNGRWQPILNENKVFKRVGGTTTLDILNIDLPNHPNLVQEKHHLLKTESGSEIVAIAPDYSKDRNLHEHIDSTHEIRIKGLVDAMKGCFALHQIGVMHSDFKPMNIILIYDEETGIYTGKLCDHAFAIKLHETQIQLAGTKPYMDSYYFADYYKERNGFQYCYAASTRGDIFSAGLTAFETLISSEQYEKAMTKLNEILQENTTNPEKLQELIMKFLIKSKVPPLIIQTIMGMIQVDREARPGFEIIIPRFEESFNLAA